jgi:hypothetical protein
MPSHMNIPAKPLAATAVTEFSMRPNQNMSVRLYVICMSCVPMIGKATNSSFLRIPPWVRSKVFVVIHSPRPVSAV